MSPLLSSGIAAIAQKLVIDLGLFLPDQCLAYF